MDNSGSADPGIVVGRVVKPHGVEGEVVVEPETDFVDQRFSTGSSVFFFADGSRTNLTVGRVRTHSGRLLVEFEEIADRDAAEKLREKELKVEKEDVVDLPADEYYGFQVVGLQFYAKGLGRMGTVTDVWSTGERTFLEVDCPDHGVLDLPAVPKFVREVDLSAERLVADLPGGWEKLLR